MQLAGECFKEGVAGHIKKAQLDLQIKYGWRLFCFYAKYSERIPHCVIYKLLTEYMIKVLREFTKIQPVLQILI
jgi:hypothetical protein